jgi:uncharacterized OB-fold protein
MVMMAVLPISMLADCAYTDSIFPGQYKGRPQHIEASVPVGTIVDNITADLVAYTSTDSAVILPYMAKPSKFFALKPGVAAISYSERTEVPGEDPCITNHSIMYTVTKGNPTGGFMLGQSVVTEYNYDMGDRVQSITVKFNIPTVFIDGGVPFKLNKTVPLDEIQFISTDPNVAVINESGYLTILGGGTTVITASWTGNNEWKEAQASLTVNVDADPIRLRVAGIRVTKENCTDVLGDGKKQVVYDPEYHWLTLKDVNWDFSDHSINAKYGVIEYWDDSEDLNIEIEGKCSFTNTTMGINTEVHNSYATTYNAGLYIYSSNGGSLTITGEENQIRCGQTFYVDGVQFKASSTGYRVKTVESSGFKVFDGSSVVVSSKGDGGLAIDTKWIYLQENVSLGEGLKYVPAEVSASLYGFYDANNQKATTVSVLSQEVSSYGEAETTASDKATDISLSETATGGKEEVAMVVLGEQDKYNSEAEQLEIYSLLSEDVVKEAITTFGAGSEALKSALPGSISFFVPAGVGSIQIEFCTKNGYVNVLLEDVEAQLLAQTVMGWMKVPYNTTKDTYVVIYLTPSVKQSVPAYIAAVYMDDEEPATGAYIKNIKVDPKDVSPTTGIENRQEPVVKSQKLIKDGQMIILRGDKTFTVMGQEMK